MEDYTKYKEVLTLLKLDFGISNTVRDAYYNALLCSSDDTLARKGIHLDMTVVEDQMLLSDYAAYVYRHRTENVPMSKNLRERIADRKVQRRAQYVEI